MQHADKYCITVLYFASLAERAKTDSETLDVTTCEVVAIYEQLSAKYGFDLPQDKVAVAINHEFASWQDVITSGDVLAFIPPVAGG